MGVKKIRIDTTAFHDNPRVFDEVQHYTEHLERMVAILEARPEVDLPGH